MTAPRVSEEEASAAALVLSTLADNRYKDARRVLLSLAAERASLEAKLAACRQEAFHAAWHLAGGEDCYYLAFEGWLQSLKREE